MRKVKAQLVRRGTFPQLHTILITYHFLSSHFPGMIKEQSRDAEQNFNCFFFFIFSSPLISFIRKPQVVPAAFVFLCARISGTHWRCTVGAAACPARSNSIRRTRRSESLPLEGGAPRSESKIYMTAGGSHTSTTVVRPQPDRMRSKVAALYQPVVIVRSFDLISRN